MGISSHHEMLQYASTLCEEETNLYALSKKSLICIEVLTHLNCEPEPFSKTIC